MTPETGTWRGPITEVRTADGPLTEVLRTRSSESLLDAPVTTPAGDGLLRVVYPTGVAIVVLLEP